MKIYAIREDNDKRILVELQCDHCGATIKPHKDIANSGWIKRGIKYGNKPYDPDDTVYSCPDCVGRED